MTAHVEFDDTFFDCEFIFRRLDDDGIVAVDVEQGRVGCEVVLTYALCRLTSDAAACIEERVAVCRGIGYGFICAENVGDDFVCALVKSCKLSEFDAESEFRIAVAECFACAPCVDGDLTSCDGVNCAVERHVVVGCRRVVAALVDDCVVADSVCFAACKSNVFKHKVYKDVLACHLRFVDARNVEVEHSEHA